MTRATSPTTPTTCRTSLQGLDDQVATYRGLIESLARKFVGRNGAEFDDLVQEGLLSLWQAMGRKIPPSADVIENRMRNYVRLLGSQIGRTPIYDSRGRLVDYGTLLPLDDFRNLSNAPIPLLGWDVLA